MEANICPKCRAAAFGQSTWYTCVVCGFEFTEEDGYTGMVYIRQALQISNQSFSFITKKSVTINKRDDVRKNFNRAFPKFLSRRCGVTKSKMEEFKKMLNIPLRESPFKIINTTTPKIFNSTIPPLSFADIERERDTVLELIRAETVYRRHGTQLLPEPIPLSKDHIAKFDYPFEQDFMIIPTKMSEERGISIMSKNRRNNTADKVWIDEASLITGRVLREITKDRK